MNQQKIDEIKARCDKAIRDEYPEKVYGSAAYYLITSDVPELLAEVEQLTAENAKLQEKQTVKEPISEPRLWHDGRDYILHICPKCHEEVSSDEKYCSGCGQKLLWEE
jgi:hypothetical protein